MEFADVSFVFLETFYYSDSLYVVSAEITADHNSIIEDLLNVCILNIPKVEKCFR